MSTSYYAYTIIGCQLPKDRLWRVDKKRGCQHQYDLTFAFCPQCGKPTWIPDRVAIFDEDTDTIGGFSVIRPADQEFAYIAAWYAEGKESEPVFAPLPLDTARMGQRLYAVLESLGLRDEARYGLWTVLDWG